MKKIIFICFFTFVLSIQAAFSLDFFQMGKEAFEKQDYKTANVYFVKALTENPNEATWRYYYAQTLTYLKNYKQARIEYTYVTQLAPNTLLANYSKRSIAYLDQLEEQSAPQNTLLGASGSTPDTTNYLSRAISSDGELDTWNLANMPIKVYFDNTYKAKPLYVDAAKNALTTWQSSSNGLLEFQIVTKPEEADVTVIFKGAATQTENQLLGLTNHVNNNGYIAKATVTLYTLGPNFQVLTPTDIYNVALHEYAHMLGVSGHSDNKDDILYAAYNPSGSKERKILSQRDINTIIALYSIDKNPYSTSLNSINRVLGSKEDRMKSNLQQDLDYIKQIPGNATGYINAGTSYKKLGKEFEALTYYQKALEIEPTNIAAHYAIADIYAKRNDVKNAELYYKRIIKYHPKEQQAYYLLTDLYIKNKEIPKAKSLLSSFIYKNPKLKNDPQVVSMQNKINKL